MRRIATWTQFLTEAEDLEDLMTDLGDIGAVDKYRAVMHGYSVIIGDELESWDETTDGRYQFTGFTFRILETEIYGIKDANSAALAFLDKCRKGEFVMSDLSDLEGYDPGVFWAADDLLRVYTKEKIMKAAKEALSPSGFVNEVGSWGEKIIQNSYADYSDPEDFPEDDFNIGVTIAPDSVWSRASKDQEIWRIKGIKSGMTEPQSRRWWGDTLFKKKDNGDFLTGWEIADIGKFGQ